MPRMDKTGPMGLGAKTGRGLGLCNNENRPRLGRGRGLRRCFNYNDKESLINQKNFLEKQLEEVNNELERQ